MSGLIDTLVVSDQNSWMSGLIDTLVVSDQNSWISGLIDTLVVSDQNSWMLGLIDTLVISDQNTSMVQGTQALSQHIVKPAFTRKEIVPTFVLQHIFNAHTYIVCIYVNIEVRLSP
jgi:hypothetical protein